MYKRSMGGRIYQQKEFRPKLISLQNPQQRSLNYPIKGDTAFDPKEYGKKHYLSPKHSAIRSIIFNQDYESLMTEKRQLIDRINSNRNTHRFDRKADKQKNQGLENYLNNYVIHENRLTEHSNSIGVLYNLSSRKNSQSRDKIAKGQLFRQGSINDVLKPYQGFGQGQNIMERNRSMFQMGNKNEGYYRDDRNYRMNDMMQSFLSKKQFTRCINPNNLNSNF